MQTSGCVIVSVWITLVCQYVWCKKKKKAIIIVKMNV